MSHPSEAVQRIMPIRFFRTHREEDSNLWACGQASWMGYPFVIINQLQNILMIGERRMFLTARELAATLKVSVATVRAWQREGLPHEPAGRLPRYMLEAVQRWLRDREARKRLEREARRLQKVA